MFVDSVQITAKRWVADDLSRAEKPQSTRGLDGPAR